MRCVFDRSTLLFVSGARHDDLTADPVTQVAVDLDYFPDKRTQRWDGASGVRQATVQELADYDISLVDLEAQASFDSGKALKALALYTRDRLNELRAFHALLPLTVADVKTGVVAKYKLLP